MRSALDAFQVFLSRRVGGPASCSILFLFQTGTQGRYSGEWRQKEHPSVKECGQTVQWLHRRGHSEDTYLLWVWSTCFQRGAVLVTFFRGQTAQRYLLHCDRAVTLSPSCALPFLLSHLSRPREEIQLSIYSNLTFLYVWNASEHRPFSLEGFQLSHWAASFATSSACCWSSGSEWSLDTTIWQPVMPHKWKPLIWMLNWVISLYATVWIQRMETFSMSTHSCI